METLWLVKLATCNFHLEWHVINLMSKPLFHLTYPMRPKVGSCICCWVTNNNRCTGSLPFCFLPLVQIGNGWNVFRGASEDYILNFWIYFVIGFCSLKVFLESLNTCFKFRIVTDTYVECYGFDILLMFNMLLLLN